MTDISTRENDADASTESGDETRVWMVERMLSAGSPNSMVIRDATIDGEFSLQQESVQPL
ncbi:hypothetical protein [Natronobacterium gregoryi]|uniref:Uncharacterized protein n=2 Tax=Natronobacterium gregoryi TaxID=44930 RepID=L0AHL9_NATGS|nr:hypothetical protein [Natronobacterium gregoryi]AFZ73301.1 hypothetical protein Natgr_2119 [Natronobacterium gregoryi SP2]SFJ37876.1 hypothetical protein SAMN05443661_12534 [Natronobacterium gregoryi]